jgi:hypothetical protein
MRLAEFISANIELILAEWEAFARTLLPGAKMTILALRDDAESILRNTVRDMQIAQSLQQQGSKSSFISSLSTIITIASINAMNYQLFCGCIAVKGFGTGYTMGSASYTKR